MQDFTSGASHQLAAERIARFRNEAADHQLAHPRTRTHRAHPTATWIRVDLAGRIARLVPH